MSAHGEEYIALLDQEHNSSSQESIDRLEKDGSYDRPLAKRLGTSLPWTTLLLCTFIVADLLAFLYVARTVIQALQFGKSELEFRNPYVGLSELYASGRINASHHDPIVNVPRVAVQVSQAQPQKIFPEDEHKWLTNFGTVSPYDRHLYVSTDIHTILQFRAMDYGMERCALALRLPPPPTGNNWTLSNPSDQARINIRSLDVPHSLDPRKLSWDARPRASSDGVTTMVARPGEEMRLAEFPCSWGSLYTYEVSCAEDAPDCLVDVLSSRNGTWGVFMYQYQTV